MKCVERSRKVSITVSPLAYGTLEFAIEVGEESDQEDGNIGGAKQDIQGEVCSVSKSAYRYSYCCLMLALCFTNKSSSLPSITAGVFL